MKAKNPKAAKKNKALEMLLENSIALQKMLTGLATDLKTLNKKISSLLKLFEEASTAFKGAKIKGKGPAAKAEIPKELIDKVDALVKQNKTIARGLLLLEKAMREKEEAHAGVMPARPVRLTKPLTKRRHRLVEEPEEETEEATEEEAEEEAEEEYKPEPLPEFTF